MKSEQDILDLISSDSWMMGVLREVYKLDLPDWWIGAGFVRNKIWDALHGYEKRTPLNDIDVIYFDPHPKEDEIVFQNNLRGYRPELEWSVTNQALVHAYNKDEPYTSSTDALSKWVETPTCVGVTMLKHSSLALTAPHGIEDLINLRVRISPGYTRDPNRYIERIEKKNWKKLWPKLNIIV